ncbi:FAD-dependent monooxygenase [Actinomadura sp. KC06]|uniref:FAD-dependent oxidoreductase n=1 Tax=Actinomadura sp. KC06 TaxID=2530369 RepID=UPI001A9F7A66|nr:FAD-dependent monooxygenase [Actinomadura sp. KC06]
MGRVGERAVVLGAGMAGLLAARVLAGACEQVTIVERDEPPGPGRPRKGVPQGRHAHMLMPRGQEILRDLFPGLEDELIDAGAVVADPSTEHRFNLGGHALCRVPRSDRAVQASRPLLEGAVRERVRALDGVVFAHGCDAVGLVAPDPRRVTGVRIMRRVPGSAEEELPADLVVDATGRAARTRLWLESLGYDPAPREEIEVGVAYASRPVRLPLGSLPDKAVVVGPGPGRPRGMALIAIEGDRHLLTVAGLDKGHRPPTDPEGFLAYMEGLAPPDVARAVRAAEPLGEISAHRYPSDLRHRYERLRRFPAGLLVTGDALCSFNPIYAQGMTVACLEAQVLARCLDDAGARDLTRRYFRAVAKALDVPWRMAVAADLSMPEVPGRRGPAIRLLNAYVGRVQAAAARDPEIAGRLVRVIGLLDPPTALMRPSVLAAACAVRRTGEALPGTTPHPDTASDHRLTVRTEQGVQR